MRRRLSSAVILVCVLGFSLLGVAGKAEAVSKFAYKCEDGAGISQICVMNSDGTGETQITNHLTSGFSYWSLDWSSDGTKIAVTTQAWSLPAPNCSITVFDAASGTVVGQFSQTLANNIDCAPVAWSPEIPPNVAAISPLGQMVIVFLLGAVTALYFSRQREPLAG